MPDPAILLKLAHRLQDLTTQGKIDWKETADENAFQATVGQYVVTIRRERGDWDVWKHRIGVVDLKGTVIDEAGERDETLSGLEEGGYGLPQLFEGARRKAINAEKKLSDLLSSLDVLSR